MSKRVQWNGIGENNSIPEGFYNARSLGNHIFKFQSQWFKITREINRSVLGIWWWSLIAFSLAHRLSRYQSNNNLFLLTKLWICVVTVTNGRSGEKKLALWAQPPLLLSKIKTWLSANNYWDRDDCWSSLLCKVHWLRPCNSREKKRHPHHPP